MPAAGVWANTALVPEPAPPPESPAPPADAYEPSSPWVWRGALALVTLGALVLRLAPFFRAGGVLGWPVDYDEGVYTAASALLWRGTLPYRDFVFVHPPGLPILLGLVTAWPLSPSAMLIAGRLLMGLVGAANVVLVGSFAKKHAGLAGGLLAASLYGAWPEAVMAERGVFLEPVLSLCLLGMATLWTLRRRRPISAGVLMGLALTVKTWAAVWLLAALITRARSRELKRFAAASAATLAAVLVPFHAVAAGAFIREVAWLQLVRPPDGDMLGGVRFHEMFLARSPVPLVVLLLCAAPLLKRWKERAVGLIALSTLGLVLSFLVAAAYWNQYNAHLAAPLAVLVGLGFGSWWRTRSWTHRPWAMALAVALCAALVAPSLLNVLSRGHDRQPEQARRAATVRAQPGAKACAFEAFDLLLADRLPYVEPNDPTLVDSYGQMVLDAIGEGRPYASMEEAFKAPSAQRLVVQQLQSCDVVVAGWRAGWQLDAASKAWLEERFRPVGDGVYVKR